MMMNEEEVRTLLKRAEKYYDSLHKTRTYKAYRETIAHEIVTLKYILRI